MTNTEIRTIRFDGRTFTLKQDAYYNEWNHTYQALAESDGKEYMVRWEIINEETEWEDEVCDWDHPFEAVEVDL